MKILFLSDHGTEHMADHLFHGLVELYGNDSLIDYPFKPKYHMRELKDTGDAYLNWCQCLDPRESPPAYNEQQIVKMVNDGEIELVISSIRAYQDFSRILDQTRQVTTLLLNGEDDTDWWYRHAVLGTFSRYLNRVHFVIQREYKGNIKFDRKVIPMYGPLPLRNFPNLEYKQDKSIDVFCHLGDTHPFRKQLRNQLLKLGKTNGWKVDIGANHYPMDEYFRRMNDSKICVHAGGAGWESTHYLNIPLAKSMLLAQPPANCLNTSSLQPDPVVYPNNFKDGISAVFYNNDFSNMESLINRYLNDDAERERVTLNGYEHAVSKLSSKSLAEYIIQSIDNVDLWKSLV